MNRATRQLERSPERRRSSALVFLGVLLCGCGRHSSGATSPAAQRAPADFVVPHVPSVSGHERLSYRVTLEPALSYLDVEVCPSGFRIERLEPPSLGAERLLSGGKIITPRGDCSYVAATLGRCSNQADECLRYRVSLPPTSRDGLARIDNDLLASPDWWLWVPTPQPEGVQLAVHFELPSGMRAFVPWQAVPGADGTFSPTATVFEWKSAGAFGHADFEPLRVPGAELELAELGAGFDVPRAALRNWLLDGAEAASSLFGRFPLPHALVILVPRRRVGPAFGMALRGGGPAIVIELDRHASTASLGGDWTSTHEFLHLGVPRLPLEDAWFFEGLATYYTELTRARAGTISGARAYQHLIQGFARGARQGGSLSLREESARMRERHSFQRVYWAGAAIAFTADLAARRATGEGLDRALRSFAECCAASERAWTAEQVLAELDARLGAPYYSTEARRWLDRKQFPDLSATFRALGVSAGPGTEARFGAAPEAALRDALVARPVLPSGAR